MVASNQLTYRITGKAPLILHNARLSDPLNRYTKLVSEISSKRKKTEDDLIEMARREFLGSLYTADRDDETHAGAPVIPGANLERMFIDAAKKFKMGPKAKAGLFVHDDDPILIEYEGPKSAEGMWAKGSEFALRASCKVGMSRVIRTRPRFHSWALTFTVTYDRQMLDESDLHRFMDTASDMIGLGDWRPKHGRFSWEVAK